MNNDGEFMDDVNIKAKIDDNLRRSTVYYESLNNRHFALMFDVDLMMDDSNDELLIEFTENQLELFGQEKGFTVKGKINDDAMCFTEDKSFELRIAPTSDTLLLPSSGNCNFCTTTGEDMSHNSEWQKVYGIIKLYRMSRQTIDLYLSSSKLSDFQSLMNKAVIPTTVLEAMGGEFGAEGRYPAGYTFEYICQNVRANVKHVKRWLRESGCICVKNLWYMVSTDFILSTIELDDPSKQANTGSNDDVVAAVRQLCSVPSKYCLDYDYIARLYAGLLLKSVKSMKYSEFYSSWIDLIQLLHASSTVNWETNWKPNEECFRGIAVKYAKPTLPGKYVDYICYLNRMEIPGDFEDRLQMLFEISTTISWDDLHSYLIDLVCDEDELARRLNGCTYSTIKNNQRYYILR
ncbi:hypothetical protein GJ496_007636 [Pomphorhynchus laevis]|nr:hypothetical protein GJ496_007636 [Pomphorhynchus laevis]